MEVAEGSGDVDWSRMSIADLHGTELEWSTVLAETRKMKRKTCLFCKCSYIGGPFRVRQHLDRAMKKREVCGFGRALLMLISGEAV
jgi:hypothetical protein